MSKIKVAKATVEGMLAHIAQKRDNGGIQPAERIQALANADNDNQNLFQQHIQAGRGQALERNRPTSDQYDGSAMKWFVGSDARGKPTTDEPTRERALSVASKAYEMAVLSEPNDPELEQLSDERSQRIHKDFQRLHDGMTLCQIARPGYEPRTSKHWPRYMRLGAELVKKIAGESVSKIMTTTGSGTGLEFIPNTLSGTLVPLIKQELVLGNAFPHMNMPDNPYRLPIEGIDVTPYLLSEVSSDGVDDANNTIGAKTKGTSGLTLVAAKLGIASFVSGEASEDSIIDAIGYIRSGLARTMAEGIDTVIMNGDNLGSLDVDSAGATDYRRAWKGLRKLTAAAAKVSGGAAALTASKLLGVLAKMGKFSQKVEDTVIIVSPIGLVHLYGDTAFNRADAVGANNGPPLLTGQVTKVFGRPVIVSGAVREDLNGSGFYDGSTTSSTIAVLAHRPSFVIGDRRNVTVKAAELIRSDRTMLVATWRGTFARVQPETTSGQVAYNVGQVYQINKNATF